MARTPPVLVASADVSSWQTTTSPKTIPSVSWQTGDVVVVLGGVGDEASNLAVPTVTGLTFSQVAATANPSGNVCDAWVWVATAASNGSGSITITKTTGPSGFGAAVMVFRGSDGIGATADLTSTAKTVTLARGQAESAVVFGAFDWSASSATASFTPAGQTSIENARWGSSYTVHVAVWEDEDAAGSDAYGVVSSSTGNYAKIAVEVLGHEDTPAGLGYDVIVGGVKKAVVNEWVVVGGVKKAVVNKWVIIGGAKEPLP